MSTVAGWQGPGPVVIAVSGGKGGSGKTTTASLLGLAAARCGLHTACVDVVGANPNASHRFAADLFLMSGPVPTLMDGRPVAEWWREPQSGLRVVLGPSSQADRGDDEMAAYLARVLRDVRGALDVLVLDLDTLAKTAVHRVALDAADVVVLVVDHQPETTAKLVADLAVMQSPTAATASGLAHVPVERTRFVYVDHKDGRAAGYRLPQLLTYGALVGQVDYSPRLEALAAAGQVAGMVPEDVRAAFDQVVRDLFGLPPVVRSVRRRFGGFVNRGLADGEAVTLADVRIAPRHSPPTGPSEPSGPAVLPPPGPPPPGPPMLLPPPVALALAPAPTVAGDRYRVLLRALGWPRVDGATVGQALAVAFAVSAAGRPMSGDEVAELTGYAPSTVQNVYTKDHPVLTRDAGRLAPAAGVWTDHGWLAELARRAASTADRAVAGRWLVELVTELGRAGGPPFEGVLAGDRAKGRRRDPWGWVDWFPDVVPARVRAGQDTVEAALSAAATWQAWGTGVPRPSALSPAVVAGALCRIALALPSVPVPRVPRGSPFCNSGELLLVAAHGVAAPDATAVADVRSCARRLCSTGAVEPSHELADALGL